MDETVIIQGLEWDISFDYATDTGATWDAESKPHPSNRQDRFTTEGTGHDLDLIKEELEEFMDEINAARREEDVFFGNIH